MNTLYKMTPKEIVAELDKYIIGQDKDMVLMIKQGRREVHAGDMEGLHVFLPLPRC